MHCKGALLYNHYTKMNKLNNKYPLIQDGDKIKFLNMRQPNRMSSNVISFITKLPTELDLHNMIDYDLQYEKAFVEPLTERGNAISSGGSFINSSRNYWMNVFKSFSEPDMIIFSASLILSRQGAGVDDLTASIPMILSLGS